MIHPNVIKECLILVLEELAIPYKDRGRRVFIKKDWIPMPIYQLVLEVLGYFVQQKLDRCNLELIMQFIDQLQKLKFGEEDGFLVVDLLGEQEGNHV